jgi:glyoxylase-like metal-dependent hydrolase (beta-lactamase superfamily II)
MAKTRVIPLDLNFQGTACAIASYLILHSAGAVLIESGPGSTIDALRAGLAANGLSPSDVTHVLLTHIHLDHAGASGWLARQGALIYVHPIGAPHLANPAKLLQSAGRIYGDRMFPLWGEFLAVPQSSIVTPHDEEEIVIGSLRFVSIDTPGHAEHHYAYMFEGTCFSGDVGGVRIGSPHYLRVPMPPPELHLGKWRSSVARLRRLEITRIAPTHFGLHDDPDWQMRAVEQALDDTERWLETSMAAGLTLDDLRLRFSEWMNEQALQQNLAADTQRAYELANPLGMSADGLFRYWTKVRRAA